MSDYTNKTPYTFRRNFEHAKKPVCRDCGCTDITAEIVNATWSVRDQMWLINGVWDKGHYCALCDGEARIDWEIVI